MKTFIYLVFLIPAVAVAQSKKELNAQLLRQSSTNDSLARVLNKQKFTVDSLRDVTLSQQKQIKNLEYSNTEYSRTVDKQTKEISRLEEQLDICISKEKQVVQPKTNKPETNPFGGSAKGNGNAQNDDSFGTNIRKGGGGSGTGSGKGGKLGNNDNGSEPTSRMMIIGPKTSNLKSDQDCNIVFSIVIDATGNVVGTPTVDMSRTTTLNQELIHKVSGIVKEEVRYTKSSGAKNITKTITVHIDAN